MSEDIKAAPTTEEAKAVLQAEIKARIDACSRDINEVLEKHKCSLDVGMIIKQNSIQPLLSIVPKE